jgi:hypothetical protein
VIMGNLKLVQHLPSNSSCIRILLIEHALQLERACVMFQSSQSSHRNGLALHKGQCQASFTASENTGNLGQKAQKWNHFFSLNDSSVQSNRGTWSEQDEANNYKLWLG